MTTPAEQAIIDQFNRATEECLERARQLFPEFAKFPAPEIRWDIRARRLLGQARTCRKTGNSVIRYNLAAAMLNPTAYANTVPHEVAHVVEVLLYGEGGHGWSWRRVARMLGCNGQRCVTSGAFAGLASAPGVRRTRYYAWLDECGDVRHLTKKQHTQTLRAMARGFRLGMVALVDEKLMTPDEFAKCLKLYDTSPAQRAAIRQALAEAA